MYRRLRRGRKYEFPQNVCVGGYALPCRKLKMFLLSHLLFSVLVCRLLFRTLISKFYYDFFFFKQKKKTMSIPLFNIRTSNFSVEAERFFYYHDHDYNYYNHNDYNYKYNLYIYYCYYYYYLFTYLFIFCGLRLTKAFITCSQSRSL